MADRTIMQDNQGNRNGEVRIANDVISVIAGMALSDVQGVYIDGRLPEAFIDKSNSKNIMKAIKVDVNEGRVIVSIGISVEYGKIVPEICSEIQDKIKNAVNTMTGFEVARVDVTVDDLIIKKEPKGDNKK